MKWHNNDVPVERDVQSVTSSAGGGSIGCEAKDVSEEDAACSRDAHGSTEPESSPLSPPRTPREFEQALRTLGFSRRQAKAIAGHGFKALADAEPAEDMSEELVSLLKQTLEKLN